MARRVGVALARLAGLGVVASVMVPTIPMWPFGLLEHFRLQFVVVGILVAAACAALRIRVWFDAVVIATILNAYFIVPDLTRDRAPLPEGVPVRLLVANVHTSNSQFGPLRDLIAREHPDVIGLVEVDDRWLKELAPALGDYTYKLEEPRDDNFGVALYSRTPMTGVVEDVGSFLPSVIATVELDGARLGVILTHPIPPVTSFALSAQEDQLEAIAARSREQGTPRIVAGDFNATPWSRPFVHFAERSRLCDTRAGFGLQASFPTWSTIMRIPIDHVMASCSIGVRDRRITADIGSDHFPVVIDLVVPR